MIKSFIVDSTSENMRLDRWLRSKLGKFPQSLIEKNLRAGKIKLNRKKIKSSFKVKRGDKIDLFNFNFKEIIFNKYSKQFTTWHTSTFEWNSTFCNNISKVFIFST